MEHQQAEQLVRTIFRDVIDGRSYDRFDELFDPEYVDHSPFGDLHGKDGFMGFLMPMHEAFPNHLQHTVSDVTLLEPDLLVWNIRVDATFDGSFLGVPGRGQRIELHVANAGRARNGRAVEHWALGPEGLAEMLRQMDIDATALAPA